MKSFIKKYMITGKHSVKGENTAGKTQNVFALICLIIFFAVILEGCAIGIEDAKNQSIRMEEVTTIIDSLQDDDVHVRQDAEETLKAILEDTAEDKSVRGKAIYALVNNGDESIFNSLIIIVQNTNDDEYVRSVAADALGRLMNKDAVEPLIVLLADKNRDVRLSAVHALGDIEDNRAVVPLTEMLNDEDQTIRSETAVILGNFKDENAVEALVSALQDKEIGVRRNVIDALVRIDNDRAQEVLFDGLYSGDEAIISQAYKYFIAKGKDGTQDILISALKEYGDFNMAQAYLNSNDQQLISAAYQWAADHDVPVEDSIYPGLGPQWGSVQ